MARKRSTYDELYFMYRGWVVLILKQFMYKGYDESARVLSSIMEYKLYESRDGLTSAGPDKDKIMRYLSANHINYVIAEFGEITEIHSFPDNRFYQYLAAARDIPVERVVPENIVEEEDNTVPEQTVPERPVPPEWLKPGLQVRHKAFGVGSVCSISIGTYLSFSVRFREEEKKFLYPDAFEKGHLHCNAY